MRVRKAAAAASAWVLLTGMIGVVALATPATSAPAGVTSTTTRDVEAGTTAPLAGVGVAVDDTEQVSVTVATTRGSVAVEAGTGVSLAYGYAASGSEVAFSGTGAQVNAALDTLTLTTSEADRGADAMITVVARPAGNVVYAPSTGHFYEYVATFGISWQAAMDAAATRTFGGQEGYLATVADEAVNGLIATRIDGAENVWLGGASSEQAGQRVWTWRAGPRIGEEFSRCSSPGFNFICDLVGPDTAFHHWAASEPNNWDDGRELGEAFLVTNWERSVGQWNDLPNVASQSRGYVVEYGDSLIPSGNHFDGVFLAEAMVAITGTPGAPQGVVATGGLGSVSVSFTGPTHDGGSSIDTYRVVSTPGGVATECAASPCVISGLAAGQQYSFTVQAHNARGWSASSVGATARIGVLPGSPAALSASPILGEPFSASVASGGFPAATYAVTAGALPAGVALNSGTGELTGTPTTPGAWAFTVTATNIHGAAQRAYAGEIAGAPSSPRAPSAPTITTVVAGNGSAALRFSPPADDGGSPVRWYESTVDGGRTWVRQTLGSSSPSLTIYGLANGVDYAVQVRAVSDAGPGPASVAAAARPAAAPVPEAGGERYPELSPGASGAAVNGQESRVDSSGARTTWNLAGPDFAVTLAAYDTATRPVAIDGKAGSFVAYSGGFVKATGSGFAPGTSVDVWLFSEPTFLGTFVVKADGTFDAMVPLPESVAVGNHTVQVNGLSAAHDTVTAALGIQVAAAIPARLASTGAAVDPGPAIVLVLTGVGLLWIASRRRRAGMSDDD